MWQISSLLDPNHSGISLDFILSETLNNPNILGFVCVEQQLVLQNFQNAMVCFGFEAKYIFHFVCILILFYREEIEGLKRTDVQEFPRYAVPNIPLGRNK